LKRPGYLGKWENGHRAKGIAHRVNSEQMNKVQGSVRHTDSG